MKFIHFISLILLLGIVAQINANDGKPIPPWCWTKPIKPDFSLDEELGGVNWGYCELPDEDGGLKLKYKIFVTTANINGAGAPGQFYLTIGGSDGDTPELLLTSDGFNEGSTTILELNAPSVGDVNKIVLRTVGTDTYQCTQIRVQLGEKFWDFDCEDEISCPLKCKMTLQLAGAQPFDVTIQTSSKEGADTKAPIYMVMIGTEGRSTKKIIGDQGFAKGSTVKTTISSKDIGTVYAIILSETVTDPWTPEKITIKRAGLEESVFMANGGVVNCPASCSLEIENPKPAAPSDDGGGNGGAGGAGGDGEPGIYVKDQEAIDEEDNPSKPGEESGGGADGDGVDNDDDEDSASDGSSGGDPDNTYFGDGLTVQEKQNMITLTCDDVVDGNPEFGTDGIGLPNYELFIAKCPHGCDELGDKQVFGIGIHPADSAICKSAIYDWSMPITGGIIGIGIQPGLTSYEKGKEMNGIQPYVSSEKQKSFYTIKIDNYDMAEVNMRIISFDGLPHYRGRLEFRQQGVWGSVCSNGCNGNTARAACRELKYQDGVMKNGEGEQQSICQNFDGENVCGPEPTRIHYQSIKCLTGREPVMDCYRELAQGCTHKLDYIVECTIINFDQPMEPAMGTVRVVGESGQPNARGSGRLEFYKKGWGTICNPKFTDLSAEVACKQMGFDAGKLVGNVNENGVCTRYMGKNYCAKEETPILLTNLACTGSEEKLVLCGGDPNTQICSHEQDTIIECEGEKGDGSGMSQDDKNGKTPGPPKCGKLALPPIIKIQCTTQGDEPVFRGDPGSIYLVECPENCSKVPTNVWGTSIYLAMSGICKAAIHAGVIQDNGGIVEYIRKEGQQKYKASINRDITSIKYDEWEWSFVISRPVSSHIAQSIAFAKKPLVLDTVSFMQINQNIIYQQFNKRSSLFKNFINFNTISFSKVIPTFQWIASPSDKFDGRVSKVNAGILPGTELINNLSNFSIHVKLKLSSSPKGKQKTIVSHSSCGCWALVLNSDGQLQMGVRCEDEQVKSGYSMPLGQDVDILFVYDGVEAKFYIDKALVQSSKIMLNFKCGGLLDIGAYSTTQSEIWIGIIYFVVIYDQAVNSKDIKSLPDPKKIIPPLSPPVEGETPELPTSGPLMTQDSRVCVGVCTTNKLPGMPGAPDPPKEAALGQPSYGPGAEVDEGAVPDPDDENKPEEQDTDETNSVIELTHQQTGQDKHLVGKTGQKFRVKCPKGARETAGPVLGSMIYADDSAVCKSAVHAGYLDDETGGEFLVIIANGEPEYMSSFQNGIQSMAVAATARAITFAEAPKFDKIDCNTNARIKTFEGEVGDKFTAKCPEDCSFAAQIVFGIDVYSLDSKICQAAMHAGMLTDQGGEITMLLVEGANSYGASVRGGIQSAKQQGEDSPVGIKFVGDKSITCAYFKESYSPANIFHNWKKQDSDSAKKGPSQWTFAAHPTQFGLAFKQNSKISGLDFDYGSVLYNKNFDCDNGLYKVNVYFTTVGHTIFLFRYYDQNNFYALELNAPNKKKVQLVKKAEGSGDVIKAIDEIFVTDVWYRFRIVFHETNLQVWLQIGNFRSIDKLIEQSDPDVQRGTVAIATNDFDGVYFDGLMVTMYDPAIGVSDPGADKKRVWDSCLVQASKGHRQKFCKGIYGAYKPGLERCVHLYNYCEVCCDQSIPKLERILNFQCWRGCIRESKSAAKRIMEEKLAEQEMMAALLGLWSPKQGDKCDIKPKSMGDASYFVMGTVEEVVNNDQGKATLTVKFFVDGAPQTEKVEFPNPDVTECGMALVGRKDCQDVRRKKRRRYF